MSRSLATVLMTLLLVVATAQFAVGGIAAQSEDTVSLTLETVDADGNPVGNVDFRASWDGGEVTDQTLSSGVRGFDVPRGADVRIEITDDRYIRNSPYVVANATTRTEQIRVAERGTATISVAEGANPLEDATVRVLRNGNTIKRGTTGPDGNFTTEPIEQGDYEVRTTKARYYDNTTSITVGEQTQATVQLRRGAVETRFNVTDDYFEPPRPVEDAVIDIPDAGTSLTTFEDGTRSTTVPVNNEYEVEVSKEGYGTVSTTLSVGEEPEMFSVSITRQPGLTIEAVNNRVVIGESTQIDVANEYGEPVADATVSVDGENVGQTDDARTITVPIETEGDVTIQVTDGDLSASLTVEGVEPATQETPTTTTTETPTEMQTSTETETPTETETETAGDEGPGFGILAAVLAILGAGLLSRLR